MLRDVIIYVIRLIVVIHELSCSSEIEVAVEVIKNNTAPISENINRKLYAHLEYLKDRLHSKSNKLISYVNTAKNYCVKPTEWKVVQQTISDPSAYIYDLANEIKHWMDSYRDKLLTELVRKKVIVASPGMENRLKEDVKNKSSKAYKALKAIATLISYINTICYLTEHTLSLMDYLSEAGVSNESLNRQLTQILDEKSCLSVNFTYSLCRVSEFKFNKDAIRTVSDFQYDFNGLKRMIEKKANWPKWLALTEKPNDQNTKEDDKDMKEVCDQKELMEMLHPRMNCLESYMDDSPEFHRMPKYMDPKTAAKLILAAEEAGKLKASSYDEFRLDMKKWGIDFDQLFDFGEYIRSVYDWVICRAIYLEEDHDPYNQENYMRLGVNKADSMFNDRTY